MRKLLNGVLAVLLVATVFPANMVGAQYSAELEDAYDYAYGIGITTMSTIDGARMFDQLNRAEMAKMMVSFAENVLGQTADKKADRDKFSDLDSSWGDLEEYCKKAYDHNLMGVGVDLFNPAGTVDRKAFGTVMSRALYGDANNTTTPDRFSAHLDALKAVGIMTNISNPHMAEIRGYVMIMMMRADDGTPEVCKDPLVILACTFDETDSACPEECRTPVIVDCEDGYIYNAELDECELSYIEEAQGSLDVDLSSVQPQDTVPAGVIAVPIGTFDFEAGSDEDVILDSIKMEADGYGDYADLDEVAIYDDRGVKVSRERDIDSDGEVKINFINGYTIKAGGKEKLTITAKINNATATNGDTYGFTVVEVNGPESVSGLPVSTQWVEVVNVENMGILGLKAGNEATSDIKIGEVSKLGGFKMNNNNEEEDIALNSIVLEQIGGIDEDYIQDLYIMADGQKVTSDDLIWDRDEVTVAFDGDGYVFSKENDTRVEFELRGTISGEPTETVGFKIGNEDDVVAVGQKQGFRVSLTGDTALTLPVVLSDTDHDADALLVEGADVLVSFDKADDDTTTADQNGFTFGNLNLESVSSNYELVEYQIELTVTTDGATGAAFDTLEELGIQDIELGGDSYTDAPTIVATADGATLRVKFESIDLSKGKKLLLPLTVDFKNADAGNTYEFDLSIVDAKFELEDLDNGETYTTVSSVNDIFSSTSFSSRTCEVEDGSLTVDITSINPQEIILGNGVDLIVGVGQFEATNVSDVKVKRLKVSANTSITGASNVALTLDDVVASAQLIVDGTAISDSSIDGDTITFDDDFIIGQNENIDFEVIITLKDKDLSGTDNQFRFFLDYVLYNVNDEDNANPDTDYNNTTHLFGDYFTIGEFGKVTIEMDTTEDDITSSSDYVLYTDIDKTIVAGTDGVVLAKIKLNADKEAIKIRDLFFLATGTVTEINNLDSTIKNVRLLDESFESIAEGSSITTGSTRSGMVFKFEGMGSDFVVPEEDIVYAYLVVDMKATNPDLPTATAKTGVNVDVRLYEGFSDGIRVVGFESSEDSIDESTMLTVNTTNFSKTTMVAANIPTSIDLVEQSFDAGLNKVIAKLTIVAESQSVNSDGDELYNLALSGITLSATGYGGATLTNLRIRNAAHTSVTGAIANGSVSIIDLGEYGEIEPGAEATFDIVAAVSYAGSDTPSYSVSIDDVRSVIFNDGAGYKGITINLGGGVPSYLPYVD